MQHSVSRADDAAPTWVMPLIRRFCGEFDTAQMPPHVYTGVCVIMKLAQVKCSPSKSGMVDVEAKTEISALVIATFLLVMTRMQKGEMTTEVYERTCQKAIEIAEPETTENFQTLVEGWIRRMSQEDWCQGQEWWSSVPEEVMERADKGTSLVEDEDDILQAQKHQRRQRLQENQEIDPDGVLLPGLGTMMQDAVDWLSEEKQQSYVTWRDDILKRIDEIE